MIPLKQLCHQSLGRHWSLQRLLHPTQKDIILRRIPKWRFRGHPRPVAGVCLQDFCNSNRQLRTTLGRTLEFHFHGQLSSGARSITRCDTTQSFELALGSAAANEAISHLLRGYSHRLVGLALLGRKRLDSGGISPGKSLPNTGRRIGK